MRHSAIQSYKSVQAGVVSAVTFYRQSREFTFPRKPSPTILFGFTTLIEGVAKAEVGMMLRPLPEYMFHNDSYGYRPGRSAHNAIAVVKQRWCGSATMLSNLTSGSFLIRLFMSC